MLEPAHATLAANDDPDVLIRLFNETFYEAENTVLEHADGEPYYLPADADLSYNRIQFAHGFFASGLHEIAHWCIAGRRRRQLVDYGYWYQPDGRDAEAQAAFEAAETKPQAIEWAFAIACGRTFVVSLDNHGDTPVDREAFADGVRRCLRAYARDGFPPRARRFLGVLEAYFGHPFRAP
jgi:elongation factor P hydroxylase